MLQAQVAEEESQSQAEQLEQVQAAASELERRLDLARPLVDKLRAKVGNSTYRVRRRSVFYVPTEHLRCGKVAVTAVVRWLCGVRRACGQIVSSGCEYKEASRIVVTRSKILSLVWFSFSKIWFSTGVARRAAIRFVPAEEWCYVAYPFGVDR